VGAEALLRWRRPDGKLLGPGEFIPLAEETGLINSIGDWVLQKACKEAVTWRNAGLRPVKIAVNISARQLQQQDFLNTVAQTLIDTKLAPEWLELELTETALMQNLDIAAQAMTALVKAGVTLSIDDFGTGYSSLGYLRRFPFDSLKMDKSFVGGITGDNKSAAVARGLINLAHSLELKVIAEGVESPKQLMFLRSHGCDRVQGFLACRPIESAEFIRLLRADGSLVEPADLANRAVAQSPAEPAEAALQPV
jgi:EAL domain-containing protein (putative c-di-GMP-specific phosphodiesterase class I)